MRTSPQGLHVISRFEGCPLNADGTLRVYNDAAGHATVGIGRLLHYGHFTAADMARYRGKRFKDALTMLAEDIARFERAVNGLGVKLAQNEFDALVSFAYNCGPGALYGGIQSGLRAGNRPGAMAVLRSYTHAGGRELAGLVTRRRAEVAMFLRNDYGPGITAPRTAPAKVTPPFFTWLAWRLGEGRWRGKGAANAKARPATWAATVPARYWTRLAAFVKARA